MSRLQEVKDIFVSQLVIESFDPQENKSVVVSSVFRRTRATHEELGFKLELEDYTTKTIEVAKDLFKLFLDKTIF